MTFNEFVEKNGLTPENTPSFDHALLSAAYSAGYEEGKKNERELQCGKSNLLRDVENLKKENTELKNAKCSAGKMTLDEAIEHLDETEIEKKTKDYEFDLCSYCRGCGYVYGQDEPCQHLVDAKHGFKDGYKKGFSEKKIQN